LVLEDICGKLDFVPSKAFLQPGCRLCWLHFRFSNIYHVILCHFLDHYQFFMSSSTCTDVLVSYSRNSYCREDGSFCQHDIISKCD